MAVELALIEQLREFDTPTVAESLLALGCKDNHRFYMGGDVKLLTSVPEPMVGVAVTVDADTSTPQRESYKQGLFDAIDQMAACNLPAVVVMKVIGSRPEHECVAGDGMGKLFQVAGCAGIVSDGGARDLDGLSRIGFAMFGSGAVCDHATLHYTLADAPVTVSGVTIDHGDLLHGDNNGVYLVPQPYHHAIVEACCLTRDFETRAHIAQRRSDLALKERLNQSNKLAVDRADKCRKLMQS